VRRTLATWAAADVASQCSSPPAGEGDRRPHADLDAVAALRREETAAAAAVLGISEVHHLDQRRRRPRTTPASCAARSSACVREFRPRSCSAPTRPRCSSAPATSTTATTDHRLRHPRTPSPPPPRTRTTFPEHRADGLECTQVRRVYLSAAPSTPTRGRHRSAVARAQDRAAAFCHGSQLTETGEWFREFLPAVRRGGRTRRRGPLRRGVPVLDLAG